MARARSLSEFQKAFPDEASCVAFLFKRRWPDGFICPGCGERRAAVLKSRPRLYECLDCGRQTSITAGTAMHRSKLPLTAWFWAAHLMATHSNGMSARQLEDQLGVTYKTAWLLTQKLRRSMVDPDREPLEGVVEVDQTEIPFREGDAFLDRGKRMKEVRSLRKYMAFMSPSPVESPTSVPVTEHCNRDRVTCLAVQRTNCRSGPKAARRLMRKLSMRIYFRRWPSLLPHPNCGKSSST